MGEVVRVGDLELVQDPVFQRREWQVQRIGQGVMLATILAGLAGLFGDGPLGRRTAEAPGLRVAYDRFARFDAPAELRLRLGPESVSEGQVSVGLDREFLDRVEIRQVQPEPERVELTADGVVYTFAASPGASPTIVVHYRPQEFGTLDARPRAGSGPSASARQFVYP